MWEVDYKESWAPKHWCFWTVVLEKTLESPLDCKEIQPVHPKGDQSWVFIGRTDVETETNTLATWCEELTHLKRPWCWERLRAGEEGDNIGWDGWMASPTWWIWVWVSSWSWWRTGKPGVLQSMGSQRVSGHNWAAELNWMMLLVMFFLFFLVLGWDYVETLCSSLSCVLPSAPCGPSAAVSFSPPYPCHPRSQCLRAGWQCHQLCTCHFNYDFLA